MYGTIARFRVKPGKEAQLDALSPDEGEAAMKGYIASYIYKMDDASDEYYMAVLFKDKESYMANAESPEQDERYQEFRKLLVADPEWHDGEVVFSEEGDGS